MMERKYDENLAENKFLDYIKLACKETFVKAVCSHWIICIPKADVLVEMTPDIVLQHILIPSGSENEDTFPEYHTLDDIKVLLAPGYIILKENQLQRLRILFGETFYEKEIGKYDVLCLDGCIANLFKETKNVEPNSNILDASTFSLDNLRHLSDFRNVINEITKNQSATDNIDNFIAEYLDPPFSIVDTPETSKTDILKSKVYELYEKCLQLFSENIKSFKYIQTIFLISVESYIMHHLHNMLFRASALDMASKDELLNRILHRVKDVSVASLNAKVSNFNSLLSARYELAAINKFKSPFGKLLCVKRAVECLDSEASLTSDDLLPSLVFSIIKCNLSNWFSNLLYIKMFHFTLEQISKYNFILTTFEASLVYIFSGKVTDTESVHCPEMKFQCNSNSSTSKSESQNMPRAVNTLKTLFDFIKQNNLDSVKSILDNTFKPMSFNHYDEEPHLCHPLCNCASCQNMVKDSMPIVSYCDVNSSDEGMRTPLHIAAMFGLVDIVEYLIAKGAKLDLPDIGGMTPLLLAAYKGHQGVLLSLLYSKCSVECVNKEKNNVLHLSCLAGHDKCVKALIFYTESVGISLPFTAKNIHGDTALHLACYWGYTGIVKIILSQFPAIKCLDIKNNRNLTPFDCAHNEGISSLLSNSLEKHANCSDTNYLLVNLNTRNNLYNESSNISKDSASEDLPTPDEASSRIFRQALNAISNGDNRLACFYLNINESCELGDYSTKKCHPLCQCSNCYKVNPVINKCNSSLINMIEENYGLLHLAVLSRNYEMCKILLENGANPHLVTKTQKQTSLHLAVIKEEGEILDLLLKYCLDVNLLDTNGNSPLNLCYNQAWEKGISLLRTRAKSYIGRKEDTGSV